MTKRANYILLSLLLLPTYARAGIPVRLYEFQSFGIEYSFLSRDQSIINKKINISENDFHSYESLHLLTYYYTPFEYTRLGVGFGIDKYQISDKNQVVYNGQYGFSGTIKWYIFSPLIIQNTIRITTLAEFLHARNKNYLHYSYKSTFWNLGGGIIFQIGPILDIEVGGKAYIITSKEVRSRNLTYAEFKNSNKFRNYIVFSLCSSTGSYGSLNFDMSPKIAKGNKKLIHEASIGCAVGIHFPTVSTSRTSSYIKLIEINNK